MLAHRYSTKERSHGRLGGWNGFVVGGYDFSCRHAYNKVEQQFTQPNHVLRLDTINSIRHTARILDALTSPRASYHARQETQLSGLVS